LRLKRIFLSEQNSWARILFAEAATRRSIRRLSRIAKGLRTRCSTHAHARIAKGGGFFFGSDQRALHVNFETPPSMPPQPGMAERALDAATDVSHTIADATGALKVAVERLSDTVAAARRPGMPLATISAITREAPLASLFIAFLCGIAVARRR
jgi:hypothetical protein